MIRREVNSAINKAGHQRGTNAEDRVERLIQQIGQSGWPKWIQSGRRATSLEDQGGIDFIFLTDIGDLYLQIKSSKVGVKSHLGKKKKKLIGCVIVKGTDSSTTIQSRIISKLAELRKQLLQNRIS